MLDHILLWSLSLWPFPPGVRAILAIAAAWAFPYALRRWLPGVWRKIEAIGPADENLARMFLSLPSVLAGAAMTALTAGSENLWRDVWVAAFSAAAPALHHILKASPQVSYQGDVRDQDWQLARDVAAKQKQWEDSLTAAGVDPSKDPGDDR
jgi:hypothetical protein